MYFVCLYSNYFIVHTYTTGGGFMDKKKLTEVGTDIEEVKRLNAESGLSYNDIKAFLVKASEVHTVDEIPLNELKRNFEIDSRNFDGK